MASSVSGEIPAVVAAASTSGRKAAVRSALARAPPGDFAYSTCALPRAAPAAKPASRSGV